MTLLRVRLDGAGRGTALPFQTRRSGVAVGIEGDDAVTRGSWQTGQDVADEVALGVG